jgi:DNA-binding MarR family transcriptional regulator
MSEIKTTKLDHADHRILVCLSEQGGWTAGEIARQMGYTKPKRRKAKRKATKS